MRRRQRPRHARGRHDRRQGQQRRRRRRAWRSTRDLVVCKALGGAARQRLDRRRGQLHQLGASQGAKVISMSLGGGASTTLQSAVTNAWKTARQRRADRRGRRQRRRRDAQLPGRLPRGRLGRGDRQPGRARVLLERERRRRDRRAGRGRPLDRARRRLRDALGHLDGHAARAGVAGGHLRSYNPGATAAAIRSRLDAAVDDLGPAGRDRASASAA